MKSNYFLQFLSLRSVPPWHSLIKPSWRGNLHCSWQEQEFPPSSPCAFITPHHHQITRWRLRLCRACIGPKYLINIIVWVRTGCFLLLPTKQHQKSQVPYDEDPYLHHVKWSANWNWQSPQKPLLVLVLSMEWSFNSPLQPPFWVATTPSMAFASVDNLCPACKVCTAQHQACSWCLMNTN